MKIVIVGDGKVGSALTQQLAREGHDLVVIDNKKGVLQAAVDQLDVAVVDGNGASLRTQRQAGVQDAKLLIAVTSSDEINLLCCILAKKLGTERTIARVRTPDYLEQLYLLREELGLSMTINPERVAAREIFRLLQYPSFVKRETFAKGRVELIELPVRAGSPLENKRLSSLYKLIKTRILVCAVKRGEEVIIPDGQFVLQQDDRIFVTAPNQALARLSRHLGLNTRKIRDVMIIGGSNTAYYLAEDLLKSGIRVKIIELKPERCQELAENLPDAQIVEADGTDQAVLLSEGIAEADALITLTNMDEENLIASLFGNYLHVPTVITKINRSEYNTILQDKGIDCVISPKILAVDDIVRFVRSMENASASSVRALYRIADGSAEALEFRVGPDSRYLGVPLQELPLREGLLLASISRHGKIIIPSGSDSIQAGDQVIVVAAGDHRVSHLNDIYTDVK